MEKWQALMLTKTMGGVPTTGDDNRVSKVMGLDPVRPLGSMKGTMPYGCLCCGLTDPELTGVPQQLLGCAATRARPVQRMVRRQAAQGLRLKLICTSK
jgi:hypothetical protein